MVRLPLNCLAVLAALGWAGPSAVHADATGQNAVTPSATDGPADTPEEIAPARDGDIAISEEFDAAVREGSDAALEHFVERHPGHPLAARALELLDGQPDDKPPAD